jgi:hypothetical protein
MRRLLLISVLLLVLALGGSAQVAKTDAGVDDTRAAEKTALLLDLQNLNTEASSLDAPLARALAKAEIADAAWSLDREWAKKLLREAYELTFPDDEEQSKLRSRPAGAPPALPTDIDRARGDVRNRVLNVAGRDKEFADQLAQLGSKQLGSYEEHFRYASLASEALRAGDNDAAGKYLLQSINADPTQISIGTVIIELAARDRKAVDALIVQYIERLRAVPLSMSNQSALRAYVNLAQVVSPNPKMLPGAKQISPPGSAVMREYVRYVVESMSALEQREPGSAARLRGFLLPVWLPLRQYAPELTAAFMELEKVSRRPGEDASLPYKSGEEASGERYEKRVKDALDGGNPDELTINLAISRGDFMRARKMIDLLPGGARKAELIEAANLREAVSLTEVGDVAGAETLARQLNKAVSMLEVYPLIMRKCVAQKNDPCVTNAFYESVKQLKRSDETPYTPPAGIPSSVAPTRREFDPVLSGLARLAKAVALVSDTLVLEALDETVGAANRSEVDTGQGRVGFEADLFKLVAAKNEGRVRAAARSFEDPLRQIVALAAIDQWKSAELFKRAQAAGGKKAAAN